MAGLVVFLQVNILVLLLMVVGVVGGRLKIWGVVLPLVVVLMELVAR